MGKQVKNRILVNVGQYNFNLYIVKDRFLKIDVENKHTDYRDYALIPVEDFNLKNLTSYSENALNFVKSALEESKIDDLKLCVIFEGLIV